MAQTFSLKNTEHLFLNLAQKNLFYYLNRFMGKLMGKK